MATIKVKQVKSRIGSSIDQKRTLDALGLRKLNKVVELEETPAIFGNGQKSKPFSFCREVIHFVNNKTRII